MRKQTMGAEDPGSWGGEEAGDTWMSNYLHPLAIPWTVGNPVLVKEGAHPFCICVSTRPRVPASYSSLTLLPCRFKI